MIFALKPNRTRPARTWSTWTSRLWWSQRTASHSQSSWWPPRGRRSLPGPVTSARHVNPNYSLQHSDERMLAGTELTNIPSAESVPQCIDNIRCNGLMMNAFEDNSKVTVPQMIKWAAVIVASSLNCRFKNVQSSPVFCPSRSDSSLYCDDVDIRFSKMMNSCKVLQIRYASVERLLERLTDLRFLSIDFLNTFLHSYRVFTTADVVLDKLITIYKKPISAIPARWAATDLHAVELFTATGK